MNRKYIGFIAGTVFIILIITVSIRIEVQTVQDMAKVSNDAKEFQGAKIAGSFRLLNSGEEFAVLRDVSCYESVEGFSSKPELRAADGDCDKLPESYTRTPYLKGTQEENQAGSLTVGGAG